MNSPLVSVIIRTSFSRRGCLEEAIHSIESQTYKNIELVVIENGSKQLKSWLLEKFHGLRCRLSYYHLSQANRCIAGNLGMEKAKGELLCFLDDDDLFYPQHIEILTNTLINNHTISAAYSIAHELPSNIRSYTPFEYDDKKKKAIFKRKFDRGALFVNNYIPIQSIVFKKELFFKHGGFDTGLNNLEDWNLWTRFASQHDFLFIKKVTSLYRVPSSLSAMVARDEILDQYYPLARQKQQGITILLDTHLLKEIINEILRPCIIASIMCRISSFNVIATPIYKTFCIQNNLDLEKEKVEFNVLNAINLANSIIIELKFIWFIMRLETRLKNDCRFSVLKRYLTNKVGNL